jgi:Ca2+-binding RTX toxin-like protein
MTPSQTLLLDSAFSSYSEGATPSGEYELHEAPIRNVYGLYAIVYKKKGSEEYIFSFRGTEDPRTWEGIKDWSNNFNEGRQQYKESSKDIQRSLLRILRSNPSAKIHIVGHSLGGALAQFTAYDLAVSNNKAFNHRITMTTWNALGGAWGLRKDRIHYDPSAMDGIEGTHFYRWDDLIPRFGGAHLGGKAVRLIDPARILENPRAAHTKEALLEGLLHGEHNQLTPKYFPASEISRQFLGGLLGLIVSRVEADIPDANLENAYKIFLGKLYPFYRPSKVFMADLGVLLTTLAIEHTLNGSFHLAKSYKQDFLGFFQASSESPDALHTLTEVVLNAAAGVLSSGSQYTEVERHKLQSLLSELTRDAGMILKAKASTYGDLLLNISQTILEPIPSIPLGISDLLLFLNPNALVTKLSIKLFRKMLEREFRLAQQPLPPDCPLILDLDNDGIETHGLDAAIHFDHDGNRFAELTGWVAADDGLLVLDRNRNGMIDSGAELFGNHTLGPNGSRAANGFIALSALDTNRDLIINAQDAAWQELAIWQDRNGNALSEIDELKPIHQFDIIELNLNYQNQPWLDEHGNTHRETSRYRLRNGEERSIVDVWFNTDTLNSVDLNVVPFTPDIQPLPDIEGMGNLPSLHQAMLRDSSGELRRLITLWPTISQQQKTSLIDEILYRWAGVHGLSSAMLSGIGDRRRLSFLETVMAEPYNPNGVAPQWQQTIILANLYDQVRGFVAGFLDSHTILFPLLAQVRQSWNSAMAKTDWHLQSAIRFLLEKHSSPGSSLDLRALRSAILAMGDIGSHLLQELTNQIVSSVDPELLKLRWLVMDNAIIGSSAGETLTARINSAIAISGEAGDDILEGLQGHDLFDGGTGNDTLKASAGNDIYLFRKDFGRDQIHESLQIGSNHDQAIFLHHKSLDVISVEVLRGNLRLRFQQGDELTVVGYFSEWPREFAIDEFRFADGQIWRNADVVERAVVIGASNGDDQLGGFWGLVHRIDGLDGSDTIRGGNLDDHLIGNLGNDSLDGGAGNDWLAGGRGNDTMQGGGGQDSFAFALQDGQDTIQTPTNLLPDDRGTLVFQAGISAADIHTSFTHDMSGIILRIKNTTDQVTIRNFFAAGTPYHPGNPIQAVRFADGMFWNQSEIIRRGMIGGSDNDTLHGTFLDDEMFGYAGNDNIRGSIGNDTIFGGDGDDILFGGPGNDVLLGGSGHNGYMFYRGDGHDILAAEAIPAGSIRTGVLHFATNILPLDARYKRSGDNLVVNLQGTTDSITIQQFFRDNTPLNGWNPLIGINFLSTGEYQNANRIASLLTNVLHGTGAADTLNGTAESEYLNGYAGNDRLDGREGDDHLDGADGNDTLIGGAGDDTLHGGAGLDSVSYASSVGSVRVDLSTSSPQETGGAGRDTLIAIEDIIGGQGHDNLRGNAGSNGIDGGAGDDWIDGGAGSDTLRGGTHGVAGDSVAYSNSSAAVTVNLALSTAQNTGGGGIDTLSEFENLIGSRFHDVLTGSNANNTIEAGDGDDHIWGSAGADRHSGGGGADQFLYLTAAEASTGTSAHDVIIDFGNADRLDLSRIDANTSRSKDQAFAWIGSAAFSAPGQLRYTVLNGVGLLEGNTTLNTGAEFQIAIQGAFPLLPSNHVLL